MHRTLPLHPSLTPPPWATTDAPLPYLAVHQVGVRLARRRASLCVPHGVQRPHDSRRRAAATERRGTYHRDVGLRIIALKLKEVETRGRAPALRSFEDDGDSAVSAVVLRRREVRLRCACAHSAACVKHAEIGGREMWMQD
eukprot:4090564-Pleurochrysis_carterae.AAC.1